MHVEHLTDILHQERARKYPTSACLKAPTFPYSLERLDISILTLRKPMVLAVIARHTFLVALPVHRTVEAAVIDTGRVRLADARLQSDRERDLSIDGMYIQSNHEH